MLFAVALLILLLAVVIVMLRHQGPLTNPPSGILMPATVSSTPFAVAYSPATSVTIG
jgi:hypothetical protein